MNQEYVRSTHLNGISTIEFHHPAHNSLPSNILKKLSEEILACDHNENTRVIVLKSGGSRTFCAGASFDELMKISDIDQGTTFFMGFANVINACRRASKLIIGRVQGKAVGGGVGLASAVDYCAATKYASVKLSELNIGIGPFVVGPAVQRKMGLSAMSELSINASEWRTAAWAKEKGLFNEVFDEVDQLDTYVDDLAIRLSEYHPEAMKELKKTLWKGTEDWDQLLKARAEISGRLVLSDFTRSAIKAFKEKIKS